jgi:ectoine hydroxylase-related dioxygenase (phytanoyl-CoA dioxygenase family)
MRAVAPGFGTHAHCDVVYMGRGTHNLLTAWVPLGDVPITTGGLIVLEGSHRYDPIVRNYCQLDVDSTCANQEGENSLSARGFDRGGAITSDPAALRVEQGGRWLTAEFEMGDVLIFSVFLTHASLDNGSNTIRLSSDSRYQPASQPADERWVGDNPPGHGPQSTLEWIC